MAANTKAHGKRTFDTAKDLNATQMAILTLGISMPERLMEKGSILGPMAKCLMENGTKA